MPHTFRYSVSKRFPQAIALDITDITGDWAFAGSATQAHRRPCVADILLFCADTLPTQDKAPLQRFGAQLAPFAPVPAEMTRDALKTCSPLSVAKFYRFDLVSAYEAVV